MQVVRTTQRGEYWRLLAPGNYTVFALADGHLPSVPQPITIPGPIAMLSRQILRHVVLHSNIMEL